MFLEESVWIREKLSDLALPPEAGVLNIGSSDQEFLKTQPHIEENVLAPLRARGCVITNLDIRPARPGDYTGDITDKNLPAAIGRRFPLVICTNLLEHVENLETAFSNISGLAEDGGFILVTVPNHYPFHPDPVDTMFRPGPAELEAWVKRFCPAETEAAAVVEILSPRYYYFESRFPFWGYRKMIFWRRWFSRWRWKVSCVLLRRKT